MLQARRFLQSPKTGGRSLERAFHAAGVVMQLAWSVDGDADVFEKTGAREIGKRVGALFVDDGAVCRQISADVAFAAKHLHDVENVFAHEDLAAGEADLDAGRLRKRAPQNVDRQLLPPFTLEVQQVADVAELTLQIAPHRRFVDDAARQTACMTV